MRASRPRSRRSPLRTRGRPPPGVCHLIQHGKGGENGTLAIIDETRSTVGPLKDETAWLNTFLDARLHHLGHAYEGTTEDADEPSASRVAALRSMVESGNLTLEPPLTWEVHGTAFELPTE